MRVSRWKQPGPMCRTPWLGSPVGMAAGDGLVNNVSFAGGDHLSGSGGEAAADELGEGDTGGLHRGGQVGGEVDASALTGHLRRSPAGYRVQSVCMYHNGAEVPQPRERGSDTRTDLSDRPVNNQLVSPTPGQWRDIRE